MSADQSQIGVLLLQLGTPNSTSVSDVRKYLREFLSDPRVLDMPAPARALLLHAVILPFRPRKSAEAYRKIWTEEGSPLTIHTAALTSRVQELLGTGYRVVFGMRYQQPSIEAAVSELTSADCAEIVVLPLFPQYASAAGGSATQRALEVIGSRTNVMDLRSLGAFYDNPGFIRSAAEVARPLLADFTPDHVLFSYHGLPRKQVEKGDPSGEWCLTSETCCATITGVNRFCYRAQCFATSRGLVAELRLADGQYSTTFQSRLAGQKWIEPYTDKRLTGLYDMGVRRLAVFTPSFTADCLETLEEIGIRLRDQWEGLGGDEMLLLPCVNSHETWAQAVADMVSRHG